MPFDYSNFDTQVRNFNNAYGVEFSLNEFDRNVLRLQGLSGIFPMRSRTSNLSIPDSIYRTTFLNLYRQSLIKSQKGEIGYVNSADFLSAFENLMGRHREMHGKDPYATHAEGAWDKRTTVYDEMKKIANEFPSTKYDYMKQVYRARGVRLRDMRAKMNALKIKDYTARELAEVMVCAGALQQKLEESKRGFRGLFTRLRERTERKNLEMLMSFISDQQQQNENMYDQALEIANECPLDDVKRDLEIYTRPPEETVAVDNRNQLHMNENYEIEDEDEFYDYEMENTYTNVMSNHSEPISQPISSEPSVPTFPEGANKVSISVNSLSEKNNIERPKIKCWDRVKSAVDAKHFETDALNRLNEIFHEVMDLEQKAIDELGMNDEIEFDQQTITSVVIPEGMRSLTFKSGHKTVVSELKTMAAKYDQLAHTADQKGLDEALTKSAKDMFHGVFKCIAGYGYPLRETLLVAQKFTDEMISNYSPVKYDRQNLEKYAHNIALNSGDKFLRKVFMETCREQMNLRWMPYRSDASVEDRKDELNQAFEDGLEKTKQMMQCIDDIGGGLDMDEEYYPMIHPDEPQADKGLGAW